MPTQSFIDYAHAFASGLFELAWPARCVGCDAAGSLLCERCKKELSWIDQRWACPHCGAPFGWLSCTECSQDWPSQATVSAMTFGDSSARMITIFKDSHELRLAPVIAAAIATSLDEAAGWVGARGSSRFDQTNFDGLCFVPSTPKALRRRGFDHMELVAEELSALLDVPLLFALARCDAQDQRDLGKTDRQQNLAGTVFVQENVQNKRLLLVDDVITTGATTRTCTEALLAKEAESVTVCSLARVW